MVSSIGKGTSSPQSLGNMADPPLPGRIKVGDFKSRLAFDEAAGEVRDGPRRYLLMRPDVFMGIFRGLPPPVRAQAFQALARSVCQQGADSARAYLAHGGGSPDALLDIIEATAPQLGWGRWTFHREADRLMLDVQNSPFAQAWGVPGEPVCHAIAGMLSGVAEICFGRPALSVERQCASHADGVCRFEASPAPDTSDSTPS